MMYVGKGREEYPGIISYPDIFRLRPLEKQTNLSESDQFDVIKHTIITIICNAKKNRDCIYCICCLT